MEDKTSSVVLQLCHWPYESLQQSGALYSSDYQVVILPPRPGPRSHNCDPAALWRHTLRSTNLLRSDTMQGFKCSVVVWVSAMFRVPSP